MCVCVCEREREREERHEYVCGTCISKQAIVNIVRAEWRPPGLRAAFEVWRFCGRLATAKLNICPYLHIYVW